MAGNNAVGASSVIVLVHGLGLKPGKAEEYAKWQRALQAGLGVDPRFTACRLEMAYYSDQLHPEVIVQPTSPRRREPERPDIPSASGDSTGALVVEERAVDVLVERFHAEEPELWGLPAAGESPPGGASTGQPTARRREVTPLPAVELGPDEEYHTFVRDVIKYFGLGHREPVNKTLTDILGAIPQGTPVLLLTHSLGTVVAYDVLSSGRYRVDTWLTLGSPLGWVSAVQERLPRWLTELTPEQLVTVAGVLGHGEEAVAGVLTAMNTAKEQLASVIGRVRRRGEQRGMYRLPASGFPAKAVARWYNLFDAKDPVATALGRGQRTLADVYLDGGRERVFDILVRSTPGDPHNLVGYLQAPQTVALVQDWLERQGWSG